MTETMTADQTTGTDWSDAMNPQPTQNLPAVAGIPQQFDEFNLAVRRMLGLEDASDGEIELFFHVCQKSGLDPFNKEVYMIGRNTEVDRWEPINENEPDGQKRKVKRWVTKYTIQTGINGFRKRAREIADEKGVEFHQDDPLWCGEDAVWKEVWPDAKPPVAAKFVVYRDGKRYSFIAHYSEYVQTTRDGNPNSMWKKMPCNQTRKCAEAGALQAAFPDELGGLLLEDAVQNDPVVIDEDGNTAPAEPKKRQGGRGVGGLRDRAQKKQDIAEPAADPEPVVVEGDVAEPEPADDAQTPPATEPEKPKSAMRKAVEKRMFKLLGDIAPPLDREDRITLYQQILKRGEIASTDDLSDHEVAEIGDQLYRWGDALNDKVRDALNTSAIEAENRQQS